MYCAWPVITKAPEASSRPTRALRRTASRISARALASAYVMMLLSLISVLLFWREVHVVRRAVAAPGSPAGRRFGAPRLVIVRPGLREQQLGEDVRDVLAEDVLPGCWVQPVRLAACCVQHFDVADQQHGQRVALGVVRCGDADRAGKFERQFHFVSPVRECSCWRESQKTRWPGLI